MRALLTGDALQPVVATTEDPPDGVTGWQDRGALWARAATPDDDQTLDLVGFPEAGVLTFKVDKTGGHPLPGATLYALDENLDPVRPGEAGRLHVGGPAVAAGYPDRPDLTVRRFLPDPFAGDGRRMFRTP
ncbi:hypothetical protein ACFQX7_00065 [Luedemannella flava]